MQKFNYAGPSGDIAALRTAVCIVEQPQSKPNTKV